MTIKQLYLNGFSHHLHGSAPRSKAFCLENASAKPSGLARLAGRFFPKKLLAQPSVLKNAKGKHIKPRKRIFTLPVIFWAFLAQVLTRNASCRDALAGVQALRAAQRKAPPANDTGGICKARQRLPLAILRNIFNAVGAWIDQRCDAQLPLLNKRVVRVIDGTGASMPDTKENRAKWPYAGNQKKGCGLPVIKLAGLFCLRTGRMIKHAFGSWKQSELALARQLVGWVKKGEVLLGDCGFCGWGLIALFHRKGVDVVMRMHPRRKARAGIHTWEKPRRPGTWGKTLWRELPGQLRMRVITFKVNIKGWRTKRVSLCTTLLDTELYPDEAIIELYLRRWRIELFYRDIKVTLGLDVVRCKSPAMVEKEILMQAIAYNLVRALMLEAAMTHAVTLERLSFKGTVSRMREWAGCMTQNAERITKRMLDELLLAIAGDLVPLRPWRSEPRAVKRRPKSYQLLTKPRHKMVVSESRRNK
jgi:hypothetical protein